MRENGDAHDSADAAGVLRTHDVPDREKGAVQEYTVDAVGASETSQRPLPTAVPPSGHSGRKHDDGLAVAVRLCDGAREAELVIEAVPVGSGVTEPEGVNIAPDSVAVMEDVVVRVGDLDGVGLLEGEVDGVLDGVMSANTWIALLQSVTALSQVRVR